jgi:glucose-6-phosphate 1-dehydrogenase
MTTAAGRPRRKVVSVEPGNVNRASSPASVASVATIPTPAPPPTPPQTHPFRRQPPPRYPGELPVSAARPVKGFADAIATRPPTDLVVFGASGDLMKRLLLPSLINLNSTRAFPKGSTLVGVAPRTPDAPQTEKQFKGLMEAAASDFAKFATADQVTNLTKEMGFQPGGFTDEDLAILKERLDGQERTRQKEGRPGGQRLLYLALPPQVLPLAVQKLKDAGMLDIVEGKPPPRLILEKPFGEDLKSARELRDLLKEALTDPTGQVDWQERVLLIDHYMGKDPVAKIVDLRFGEPTKDEPWNGAFESMFNADFISRVEIQAKEDLDIGKAKRGKFMEAVGAFRDIFQSHLQQVASLLVMDKPEGEGGFDAEQTKALQAFHTLTPEEVRKHVVRGQYTAGKIGNRQVQAYREVDGVDPESNVETLFALRTKVNDPRWDGVPILFWSGKALDEKENLVKIDFMQLSEDAWQRFTRLAHPDIVARVPRDAPASLIFDIEKKEYRLEIGGYTVVLMAKEAFDKRLPHERLIEDAMDGKTELFVTPDEALEQWVNAEAVLEVWKRQPEGPKLYAPGSLPTAAEQLIDEVKRSGLVEEPSVAQLFEPGPKK